MLGVNEAEIFSPKRNNELLGEGWSWSNRHTGKVMHKKCAVSMHVDKGNLYIKLNKENDGAVKLFKSSDSKTFLYMRMVLLTYFIEEVTDTTLKDVR